MSTKKPSGPATEDKRTRDIRNGVLLAHVVISWVVVAAVRFKWWTVIAHGEPVGDFSGSHEQAFQTGYVTIAAIIAFFFTSYDIVTNADIQWPPLLASAFALGCAAEVTWKLQSEQDMVMKHVIEAQLSRDMSAHDHEHDADVARLDSGTAAVTSATKAPRADEVYKVRLGHGLLVTLFGTFSMVLLSSFLTFFARRKGT